MLTLRLSSLAVITLGILLAACAANPGAVRSPAPSGGVMTAEQIRRTGAQNAWDVLAQSGLPLRFFEDRTGTPALSTRRERTSRPGGALVVVDGVPVRDIGLLRHLPVEALERIRVLDQLADSPAAAAYTATAPEVVIEITTNRAARCVRR